MWHSKTIKQIFEDYSITNDLGLSEEEARFRINTYGYNKLKAAGRKTILGLFIAQLNGALIYVLFGAVLVTAYLGEYIDAVIIFLVIIINASLGVIQEIKAGNTLEALKKLAASKALVKRNGTVYEIPTEQIVPGDILILDAGRHIAADIRLIESVNLQVEESSLTGESVSVSKDAAVVIEDADAPLGDRINMGFASTMVTYGRGVGVVVATGMKTEVGRIADLLNEEKDTKTPLEKKLTKLGKFLGIIAIIICGLMFGISWLQGRDLPTMFLTAVSLAVASIPEGLAAIVAVVLSIGVTKMARKNAIIKKLPAVETLGSVDIVCSDKTGTLTINKMTVTKYFTLDEEKELAQLTEDISQTASKLVDAMVLCSDATLDKDKESGDPTEIALLKMADEIGISRVELQKKHPRKDELPFDSDRKLMSTLVETDGEYTVYTKGAIDALISKCTHVELNGKPVPLSTELIEKFRAATEQMSSGALRTLAAAYKTVKEKVSARDMEKDLVLLGIVGMLDPPRKEVKDSIELAKRAGVTTIMITGDHKQTAYAIALQLGIAESEEQVISGAEINADEKFMLEDRINNIRVFARVSPEHKVKIVKALKHKGHIVSMTGDGVNDAPSLKAANIGVAMGITGTDVAKNAASMILADDNFSTIISAIEQGRNIYNNIKKAVIFLLASNMGEVVAMVAAILLGFPVPLIATQLLWINLITDTLPAIALGMDPGDPDIMKVPPRDPKEGFFTRFSILRVSFGGALIGGLTLLAFYLGHQSYGYHPYDSVIPDHVSEYARTMSFMTIIICQMLYALTFRSESKSVFEVGLFSNKYLIAAVFAGILLQLLVLTIPFLQKAFKLQMLNSNDWLTVVGLGLVPLAMNELGKVIRRLLRAS